MEKSPLYKKMAIVTHTVIFLYAAAFWIQTGVMPVSILLVVEPSMYVGLPKSIRHPIWSVSDMNYFSYPP